MNQNCKTSYGRLPPTFFSHSIRIFFPWQLSFNNSINVEFQPVYIFFFLQFSISEQSLLNLP